jgi:tetratricopeptide (TPR) repeat protein
MKTKPTLVGGAALLASCPSPRHPARLRGAIVPLLGAFVLAACLLSPCRGAEAPEDSTEYRAAREAFDKGDFAEALKLAEALRDKYPDSSMAWRCAGIAMGSQGKTEEAIESYRRAIEVVPEKPKCMPSSALP